MEIESHLELAIRAACEVATELGLTFERAIVLQHRSNAIIRLFPDRYCGKGCNHTRNSPSGSWLVCT